MNHTIERAQITGLVLAGGRGSRMGGVDKGLQLHAGVPLALHALARLRPQVGRVMVNANRHLDAYESFGVPVWTDADADAADAEIDYAGPLAGFLAGLTHGRTPWLVTVPCDSPLFPLDLVAQLARSLVAHDAEIAIAATRDAGGAMQRHPVFCLLATNLRDSLQRFMHGGQRKIETWTAQHRRVDVVFDDARAFANANTAEELRQLQSP